jgi:isoleucyl-tRNA synthetase
MDLKTIDLKKTVNLPRTDFPMKANLPVAEPKLLARWNELRIYEKIRKARAGRPVYELHDGPPYANGNIHLGHAFNKILKDFIVKAKTMEGFDSPYVDRGHPRRVPQVRQQVRQTAKPRLSAARRFRTLG